METVALMDRSRTSRFASHTYDIDRDGKYVWSQVAFKFLVIAGVLVIGPIGDHSMLYAAYRLRADPIDDGIENKAKAIIHRVWHEDEGRHLISAAGQIDQDGQVNGWKSTAFRIETPQAMREAIQQEISRLFQNGVLTPS